ncbi:complement C1q-like protein 4 [Mya arenaria]|uniref:complement C1q-like protein 4 n=1 Tax=Mya arenaria TaxID=6604 RepID=UPI0022E38536|nr:complement C1q-like protein 4 [Mya arenaria]
MAALYLFVVLCSAIVRLKVNADVTIEERLQRLESRDRILEDRNRNLELEIEAERKARLQLETKIKVQEKIWADVIHQLSEESGPVRGAHRRQLAEGTEVAFFAEVSHNVDHLGKGQAIIFDKVMTNIDSTGSTGGYHGASGVFTAPLAGLYVFSATVMSNYNHSFHAVIYKEQTPLSTMWIHGGAKSHDSSSNTVVVSLAQGEEVTVRHIDTDHGVAGAYYGGQSIFCGFLLMEHFPGSPVVG